VEHDTEKWKSLSQAAFDKFDVDGDGYITSDELRMVHSKLPSFIARFTFFDAAKYKFTVK
jgi:Ca2+-binding EF-hand superfamily protein